MVTLYTKYPIDSARKAKNESHAKDKDKVSRKKRWRSQNKANAPTELDLLHCAKKKRSGAMAVLSGPTRSNNHEIKYDIIYIETNIYIVTNIHTIEHFVIILITRLKNRQKFSLSLSRNPQVKEYIWWIIIRMNSDESLCRHRNHLIELCKNDTYIKT